MAENTTTTKARKPRTVKEVAETTPKTVEEVLKDPNSEILEKQSVDLKETAKSLDPKEPEALEDSPKGAEQPAAATRIIEKFDGAPLLDRFDKDDPFKNLKPGHNDPHPVHLLDEVEEGLPPVVEDEIASGPAELAKLNPNLPDDRSKWVARLVAEKGYHILYKGSFGKAYRVADNYNKMHGFPANKVRRV